MTERADLLDALDSKDPKRIKDSLQAYADVTQRVQLQVKARELLSRIWTSGTVDDTLIAAVRQLATNGTDRSRSSEKLSLLVTDDLIAFEFVEARSAMFELPSGVSSHAVVIGATVDKQPIGWIAFDKGFDCMLKECFYMYSAHVFHDWRNQGVGKRLLRKMLDEVGGLPIVAALPENCELYKFLDHVLSKDDTMAPIALVSSG